jgi:hypothetical protein
MIFHNNDSSRYWCPMAASRQDSPVEPERQGTGCIGSYCAWWKWSDEVDEMGYCGKIALHMPSLRIYSSP